MYQKVSYVGLTGYLCIMLKDQQAHFERIFTLFTAKNKKKQVNLFSLANNRSSHFN